MNRQQQIDNFLLEAHRLALIKLRSSPSRSDQLDGGAVIAWAKRRAQGAAT
jgi:hypothetical protein